MKRKYFALLVPLLLAGCFAAEPDVTAVRVEGGPAGEPADVVTMIDPDYISLYPDAVTTELSVGRSDLALQLTEAGGEAVRLSTNPPAYVGLAASWKWMGVSASFAASPGAEERGDTENGDFRWTWYGRFLTVDVLGYNYAGFFYEGDDGEIVVFDDLSVRGGGVTVSHTFNDRRHSKAAVFRHTERQKRSAGSWYVFASGSGMEVGTSDTMIPPSRAAEFDEFHNLRRITFGQFAVGGGYGHTWVWGDHWYFHGAGQLGAGGHLFNYDADDTTDGLDGFLRGIFRFSIGYHGQKYFSGVSGLYDTFTNGLNGGSLQANYNRIYAFGGVRF